MSKVLECIKRYIKIEFATIKYCLMKEMEYRFNFIVTFFAVFSYQMAIFFTYNIIYYSTGAIGGWTQEEMSFLFGTNAIIENVLFMPFVFYNLLNLPQIINNGELDFILIKPVSSVFYVSFKRFDFSTFVGGLVSAIVYYISAYSCIANTFSLVNLIVYILLLVNGAILMSSIFLIFQCLGFYFIKIDALFDIFWAIHQFGKKAPGTVYPFLLRFILTFIIPMLVLAYFPAGISLGKLGVGEVVLSYLITGVVLFLSICFWKHSVKRYSSASS